MRVSAVGAFESALRTVNESNAPLEWARANLLLGHAYLVLPTGNRLENCRRARQCLDCAQTVYTRERHPEPWARLQVARAITYNDCMENPVIDHPKAVSCLKKRFPDEHREVEAALSKLNNMFFEVPEEFFDEAERAKQLRP